MKKIWRSPYSSRLVTLHFNSRIARALKPGGINNCVTLDANNILISRDWITADGLAHEDGHVMQAVRLGWKYLPWVLWSYRVGYRDSEAEIDADRHMNVWRHLYSAIGPVPSWAR